MLHCDKATEVKRLLQSDQLPPIMPHIFALTFTYANGKLNNLQQFSTELSHTVRKEGNMRKIICLTDACIDYL